MSEERNLRKTRVGVVVSNKMDKTIVVAVETKVRHPLYGKTMNRTTKFKAHDVFFVVFLFVCVCCFFFIFFFFFFFFLKFN